MGVKLRFPLIYRCLMASIKLCSPVPRSGARAYSFEQWEHIRPFLTQLYRNEGRILKDVQDTLAVEHDFRVREFHLPVLPICDLILDRTSMLKKRIRKWNLDRYCKEPYMLYAARMAFERHTRGKETNFVIRGRLVTLDEVKRYFRRKGVRDLHSILPTAIDISDSTEVQCHTPHTDTWVGSSSPSKPASPEPFTTIQLDEAGHCAGGDFTVMLEPCYMNFWMTSTREMNELDKLLYHNRVYYDALFDYSAWPHCRSRLQFGPLESFYHQFAEGHIYCGKTAFPKPSGLSKLHST